VIRAIEVRLESGKSLSSHLDDAPRAPAREFRFLLVAIDPPRESLYEAIAVRAGRMYDAGLVDEVRQILESGVSRDAPAFRAIGYRQVLAHIDGILSLDEAIMLTERETRRYAKRQLTWFRRQHQPVWFPGFGTDPEVSGRVESAIRSALESDPPVCRGPLSTF
jgi:tRNA dimethylallyltransferase